MTPGDEARVPEAPGLGAPAPEVRFAIDVEASTTAASIIARLDGGWRLVGSIELPSSVPIDDILGVLVRRTEAAAPGLLRPRGSASGTVPAGPIPGWPRLLARHEPAASLAVLAATDRALRPFVQAAALAGWTSVGLSADEADALAVTRLLLRRDIRTVLVGAGDPPARDERRTLTHLLAVVTAAATRRPELSVVLAGGTTAAEGAIAAGRVAVEPSAQGPVLLAPAGADGDPRGGPLRMLLARARAGEADAPLAIMRSTASLAAVLSRRIETVAVGTDAALRSTAAPGDPVTGDPAGVLLADGALVPPDPGDDLVEGVLGWSTVAIDRYRLRDRLREIRIAPAGESHGEGAVLRLAAARAALARLLTHDPSFGTDPAPDIVVATGSAWTHAPGPAVALALADVIRRPGASQLVLDHARLLGPLGTLPSEDERRSMLADLSDDLLLPLGSVLMPAGLHAGQRPGNLVVHAAAGTTELELIPGALELVDLPPGETVIVEVAFPDPVLLGGAGRRFAVDIAGGLAGLLVDLRDVPLRLPELPEQRRELLAAWQRSLWVGIDS